MDSVWKLMRMKPNSVTEIVRCFSSIRETRGSFSLNGERDDASNVDNSPPHPIPNRPLRGQTSFNQSQSQSPRIPRRNTNQNHLSSDDFLEKFKLNKRNHKDEIPHQINNHTSKDENINKSSPPPPPPDANDIFNKMKETGLIPNAVAMLDGLCKDGLVQEAMKLFGLMRQKGTIPEVVVYTAVVDGFCKAHKTDDAKRIFKKMIDNGITPNAFSYTVTIQGLCKCNAVDDAVDFCFQMLDAGHSPNVTTFVGLVDGLCREKGVDEAQNVIEDLRKKGFYINGKAIREFLDKNAPLSSDLSQAIFGKKPSQMPF
ncbi:pentatricopeptide repeat-containing protein At4g38150 [Ricinus communis]|uniref:Pentatricopeptide repeat-containing protein, putative n=1 Tax=Ricinus communis TaxID=3988 RepID=B9RKX2_RICCO|nr:pentatricopeptide repeat-containing protein At4g38150 [Ricinus communis]EEF47987.1 pentatricopeptide repeat-containing protein, putative [Ricinus communis]|eukprot:XP_002514391.1 pentatricopeptide repeat-containing protein At4g38150 [Ricinus communis]